MLMISYANFIVAARVVDLLQEAMVTLSGWSVSTQDFPPWCATIFPGSGYFFRFATVCFLSPVQVLRRCVPWPLSYIIRLHIPIPIFPKIPKIIPVLRTAYGDSKQVENKTKYKKKRIFSKNWKSHLSCSKRSENIINRKITFFYIEAISFFFSQLRFFLFEKNL